MQLYCCVSAEHLSCGIQFSSLIFACSSGIQKGVSPRQVEHFFLKHQNNSLRLNRIWLHFNHSIQEEFALYRLCRSVHSSALIKQTCLYSQSQTPWSSFFRIINYSSAPFWETPFLCHPNRASSSWCLWETSTSLQVCLEQRSGERPVLFWGCIAHPASGEKQTGGDSHMQTRNQPAICPSLFIQVPAIYSMKVKYTLIGVEACEIVCLKLTTVFYQPG